MTIELPKSPPGGDMKAMCKNFNKVLCFGIHWHMKWNDDMLGDKCE